LSRPAAGESAAPASLGPSFAAALLLAFGAAALDAVLIRSFGFVPGPSLFPVYAPPPFPERADPPGPRIADSVTLVIVDGLRVDASRAMPALEALRARGASATLCSPFPSFTRPGMASLLTGAPPRVHGYVANRVARPSPVRAVAPFRYGGDPYGWIPRIFPDDVRADGEADLRVFYLPYPDDAAHAEGALGAAYRAAVARADAEVRAIAAGVDLAREALIVTADHGHRDGGGHGGGEAVVRAIPYVAAGRGAGPLPEGAPAEAVAREIARLLGRPVPRFEERAVPAFERPLLFAPAVLLGAIGLGAGGLRFAGAALAGPAVFLALYLAAGFPLSFSIGNDEAHLPIIALVALAQALAGAAVARRIAGGPATLIAAAASALTTCAVSGPTAATAMDHPHAAYAYHMALGWACATGLAQVAAQVAGTYNGNMSRVTLNPPPAGGPGQEVARGEAG
jgi:hypothetical protein